MLPTRLNVRTATNGKLIKTEETLIHEWTNTKYQQADWILPIQEDQEETTLWTKRTPSMEKDFCELGIHRQIPSTDIWNSTEYTIH